MLKPAGKACTIGMKRQIGEEPRSKSTKPRSALVLSVLFVAIIFVALVVRAFYSVELIDEIHNIASTYNIIQGSRPFMDSWDYHTGWCLLAPVFWLYSAITSGNAGVVLFSRLLYVIVCCSLVGTSIWLVACEERRIIYLACFAAVSCVCFSILQLSYNSLTVLLVLLACSLLYCGRISPPMRYAMAGMTMGFCCVNYPTIIILAVVLPFFWIKVQHQSFILFTRYLYGITGVAVVLIVFMATGEGSSFELLHDAIKGMLTSPHQDSLNLGAMELTKLAFFEPLKAWLKGSVPVLVGVFALAAVPYAFKRLGGEDSVRLVLFVATIIVGAILAGDSEQMGFFALDLVVALVAWVASSGQMNARKSLLFCLSAVIFAATYAFTSDNHSFMLGMGIAQPLIVFAVVLAVADYITSNCLPGKHLFLPLLVAIAIAIPCLSHLYGYVYRDEPIGSLTYRVETGVFQGLFTTRERAELVQEFECIMRNETHGGDSLCVVTREPMLYMMTDASICSPQTWDPQFLARGNTSAEPLLDWFSATGRMPEVIAATNSAPVDFFENDSYEIKRFIRDGYDLQFDEEVNGVRLCIWRRR